MTTQPAPFRLDEGVWLEDLNEVILWDTKIEDLRRYQSPEIIDQSTSVHLLWKNHVCSGLPCDVLACRLFGQPDPSAYHIYLETFHCANLWWPGVPDWSVDEITQSFKTADEHLRRSLGEATFSYPAYAYTVFGKREGSLRAIFWELPSLLIGFSVDFPSHLVDDEKDPFPEAKSGARFSVSIQHEPLGYKRLKAIRRRAGDGARVNFVAW